MDGDEPASGKSNANSVGTDRGANGVCTTDVVSAFPLRWRNTCRDVLQRYLREQPPFRGKMRAGSFLRASMIKVSSDKAAVERQITRQDLDNFIQRGMQPKDDKFKYIDEYVRFLQNSGKNREIRQMIIEDHREQYARALTDMYGIRKDIEKSSAIELLSIFDGKVYRALNTVISGTISSAQEDFHISEGKLFIYFGKIKGMVQDVVVAHVPDTVEIIDGTIGDTSTVFFHGFLVPTRIEDGSSVIYGKLILFRWAYRGSSLVSFSSSSFVEIESAEVIMMAPDNSINRPFANNFRSPLRSHTTIGTCNFVQVSGDMTEFTSAMKNLTNGYLLWPS